MIFRLQLLLIIFLRQIACYCTCNIVTGDIGWNNAKLSTASKAALASKEYWELDFAEIGKCGGYKSKYYRANISDDELRALLLSINAKNTLKTLHIGRCYKIVGHGLEPLRGSTVLERLVLHGNAKFAEPIVYSIINAIYSSDKVLDRLELLHDLQWYIREARDDTSSPFHEICTNIQQTLPKQGCTVITVVKHSVMIVTIQLSAMVADLCFVLLVLYLII